ncbi:YhzD family protein [Bacillus solimangrovi]|uniref:YhzD-like protein n=1 Tax=Bacillus solimangrovi TaxID=1305675 RepID=A0A1E5LFS0_9BACI|nr:YhzD family protein [Bacillus solimangrovi]OEH92929.1 hypothetical protein BFG57_14235 [Bacillus solimangrovi]
MKTYYLTAFNKNGETLLNESFEASNDDNAKHTGEQKLTSQNLLDNSYRCVSPSGKLILFHP